MALQIIRTRAGEELAILPRDEYDRLVARAEDSADIGRGAHARGRIAAGEDEAVPFEIAGRLLDGESPVRVWREYRGLTVTALGAAAGISAAYLSQIERGRREGTLSTMAAIAKALRVGLDDLVPGTL